MDLTRKDFITIENKVRHLLKKTSMVYKNYEYHPEEMREYEFGDEKWEELYNAEMNFFVDGFDKKLYSIDAKLRDWGYKKFDGLIIYLNAKCD